ncbi:MAG: tRNA(Ile)-lysidine synthase [Halioglobus sp.]
MPDTKILNHSVLDPWLASRAGAARWCVAFSGGPDSCALLHLLRSWQMACGQDTPQLVAIHVNHGMQTASNQWQAHCEALCDTWDVPLIVVRAIVRRAGKGAEAAARDARYKAFEAELSCGDVLFMGHHLDDQVETYFLRLMRGSGLSGLSAMPSSRVLGEGELLRPLLGVQRSELAAYIEQHHLTAIEDPSNFDTAIDRNYLRQNVLPLLADRWSGYRQTVARAAGHASVAQAVIEECLPEPPTVVSVMGDPGIEQRALNSVSVDAAMIKMRSWLRAQGCSMPDQLLLAEFMRQLRQSAASASPRLSNGDFELQRYRNRIYLLPKFPDEGDTGGPEQDLSLAIGEGCSIPGLGTLTLAPAVAAGLRLDAQSRLTIRWRQGGERCRPIGRAYNQRLKKLLQEFWVPPWWRERIPLVYLDDELLAVAGLWLCESSRLQSSDEEIAGLWEPRWERKPLAFD